MSILLKNVRVLDPGSPHHGKTTHVFLKSGKVESVGKATAKASREIEAKGMVLSPGWVDMRAFSGDPGYEYREDTESFCAAAAAGGFTEVACLPNTNPVIQSKDVVNYIRSKSEQYVTRIHPVAAISRDTEGHQLTEMIDLHHAGAVAFSDGTATVWNSDIMAKALLYLQAVDGLVINRPEDRMINAGGQMNEGEVSTRLGLKGMPALSEELILQRDLKLLEYTGGKIHFSGISSARSVEVIRTAKKAGLKVTCDVVFHNLILPDSSLEQFDTNLKLNPPLRTKKDIQALWKGLSDGTIDAVVSDHMPWDEEGKKLEFDQAEFGAIGLDTLYAVLNTHNTGLKEAVLLEKLAVRPRQILGLDMPVVEVGQDINFTLFDPKEEWVYGTKDIRSRSKNTPYTGMSLTGRVKAVFRGTKSYINA